jgi:hypothetical protein
VRVTYGRPWPAGNSRPRSRRGPGVIPEAAEPVKAGFVVVVTVFRVVSGVFGRAAPAAGVQAQRPQRSEDERPGRWRG